MKWDKLCEVFSCMLLEDIICFNSPCMVYSFDFVVRYFKNKCYMFCFMVLQRRYLTVEEAAQMFWIFSALCFAKPLFLLTLVWSCSSKIVGLSESANYICSRWNNFYCCNFIVQVRLVSFYCLTSCAVLFCFLNHPVVADVCLLPLSFRFYNRKDLSQPSCM